MLEENNPFIKWIPIIIATILLIGTILLFTMPKTKFSENENRYLEKFPEFNWENVKDTSFMTQLENYTGDHFPYRSFFLSMKTKTELTLGKDEIADVYIGKKDYLIEKYIPMDEVTINKISTTINRFIEQNKAQNITIMFVPTSITINQEQLPTLATEPRQIEDIKKLYKNLKGNQHIELESILKMMNQKTPMFYRLDHHWTTMGAYFGYVTYQKSQSKEFEPLENFEKKTVSNAFNGTLYSKTNLYFLPSDQIEILIPRQEKRFEINYVYNKQIQDTFYEPDWLKKKDKYSYFLNGNHPLIEIQNKDQGDQSNLLIIKDSYANSFIPIIANDYNKISVIDPRYYKYSITEYIKENQIDNILLLYNINTLKDDLGILSIK